MVVVVGDGGSTIAMAVTQAWASLGTHPATAGPPQLRRQPTPQLPMVMDSLSHFPSLSRRTSISSIFTTCQRRIFLRSYKPGRMSRSLIECISQLERRRPQYVPSRIDDPSYVRIFDTTLRDGEQSPGATMTSKEKLDIARQLARLGVDIIEAGFPIASPDDLEAVRLIALEVGNNVDDTGYVPVICGLSRCNKKDIDAAWEAVKHALRPRIHTFIATSEIHMVHKLRKTQDEVVKIATDMVAYARSLGCQDVEFSPEDAGRSDPEFLYRIFRGGYKSRRHNSKYP